jgi:uncharacterized protein (DUF4415 family)
MIVRKQNLGSNLGKVDGHVNNAAEYDELPELTDADLKRGTWKVGGSKVSASEGKAAFSVALKKQKINLTVDPDVLSWFREKAGGRGYQTLINATLREAMQAKTMEDLLRKVIREEMQH